MEPQNNIDEACVNRSAYFIKQLDHFTNTTDFKSNFIFNVVVALPLLLFSVYCLVGALRTYKKVFFWAFFLVTTMEILSLVLGIMYVWLALKNTRNAFDSLQTDISSMDANSLVDFAKTEEINHLW